MNDSVASPAKGGRKILAVSHLAEILRCVSRSKTPIGVNELSRRVGLDKSSVSRLVTSLEEERLLQRGQDGSIRLGTGLLVIVAPLMHDLGLSTWVRPSLEALAKRTGETVNLSIWSGDEAVSVVQALGPNAITHFASPGQANPAHCTASGKVLLAFESGDVIDRILTDSLRSYTESTVTDPAILRQQLRQIRGCGYAVNVGEFSIDVCAIGAAVFNMDGSVVGSLTVTVPAYRFDATRQASILAETLAVARDLSEQFGYRR
ncbi:IclR family transcriptional regulator [uncultured Bosea sp.]|uniref:IclR family transcriptional regulator n=1 Tax=uncultured Bosea sp. TaxID=211457 RepID=UPI0025D57932|nr:IclR family transcriptional regulator [uncultured Bosea sp.]